MKLKEVMTRFPMSVAPDDELALAGNMMLWAGVRHLPVVSDKRVVGVLSERDIFAYQARTDITDWRMAPVESAMHAPVETAGPEDSVNEAAGRMALHKLGCLPITERGALVGLVTTTDVLAAQVQQAMEPPSRSGPLVADVMTKEPATVHPDDLLLDAAARMRTLGVRHLPVVDGEGRVLGILSDRDIRAMIGDPARAMEPGETRVSVESMHVDSAMTRGAVTVSPDESCGAVAGYFASLRASAVPVVDSKGAIVGILSYVDLLRALAFDAASGSK